MKKHFITVALSIAAIISVNPALADSCDAPTKATAHLVYVEKFDGGIEAGSIVKRYSDNLRDIAKPPAFKHVTPIVEYVSIQKPHEGEQQDLVISLSVSYTSSYEAVTQLVNSKDYLSLDITHEQTQCL